jgi:hypothetical protein
VEDLPYFNRIRNWLMRTGNTGSVGVLLFQPELWNPHSPVSSAGLSAAAMPTFFRVRAQNDPSSTPSPLTGIEVVYGDGGVSADCSPVSSFNTGNWPQPLKFNAGEVNGYWGFREPTLLSQINVPSSCNLSGSVFMDYPSFTPNPSRQMTGLYVTTFPWTDGTSTTDVPNKLWTGDNGQASCLRFYLDYQDPNGNWITYDDQPFQPYDSFTTYPPWPQTTPAQQLAVQEVNSTDYYAGSRTDPRTSRWGLDITEYVWGVPMIGGTNSNDEFCTYRPDGGISFGSHVGQRHDNGIVGTANNYSYYAGVYDDWDRGFQHGYWTENSTRQTYQDPINDPNDPSSLLRYTRDPDGVPRRAMAGYWSDTANNGNPNPSVTSGTIPAPPVIGLPMATASTSGSGTGDYVSRPTILHRPFKSVAELGYVFRDSPWRNLDLSFPESGDAALLDVFCINENSAPNSLAAGRVNLNTRQAPVLQALLAGTILDKDASPLLSSTLSSTLAAALAAQLVARTSGALPLASRADLVGSLTLTGTSPAPAATALASNPNPSSYYSGFSADVGTVAGINGTPIALVTRQRESVMRALADSGTARVWNLMIDIIAQSGQYRPNAQNVSSDFVVQGERRYWLHVAIDRYTGQILDKQMELVTE